MNKNIYIPVRTKYQREILAERSPQNPMNYILIPDAVSKIIITPDTTQESLRAINNVRLYNQNTTVKFSRR